MFVSFKSFDLANRHTYIHSIEYFLIHSKFWWMSMPCMKKCTAKFSVKIYGAMKSSLVFLRGKMFTHSWEYHFSAFWSCSWKWTFPCIKMKFSPMNLLCHNFSWNCSYVEWDGDSSRILSLCIPFPTPLAHFWALTQTQILVFMISVYYPSAGRVFVHNSRMSIIVTVMSCHVDTHPKTIIHKSSLWYPKYCVLVGIVSTYDLTFWNSRVNQH